MRVTTSKSKHSESFYITKGFINDKGTSTSVVIRKLGTLSELLKDHGPTRDDVMAWAREEARLETLKYKEELKNKSVQITFHADRQLDYKKQTFFRGGYLFPQAIYYGLQMNKICRKLKARYKFQYDMNAILSDLIYARLLEPVSNSWRNHPTNSMMSIAPWMFLAASVTLSNQKSIKTATSYASVTTRSSTMTVRITI